MRNEEMIHTLGNCINHCTYCADACLDEDNLEKMVDCIRLDRTCAEACAALAQILAIRHSDVKGLVEYCQKICEACAEECAKHQHDHCQACAEACRKCAEACKNFLAKAA